MTTHNAPFSHIAYQLPDGTTGVLDNHDAQALHDEAGSVDAKNLASGSVTNGKIAAGAVTEVELADGAVTQEKLAEDVWDSISQTLSGFVKTSGGDQDPYHINMIWFQGTRLYIKDRHNTIWYSDVLHKVS